MYIRTSYTPSQRWSRKYINILKYIFLRSFIARGHQEHRVACAPTEFVFVFFFLQLVSNLTYKENTSMERLKQYPLFRSLNELSVPPPPQKKKNRFGLR